MLIPLVSISCAAFKQSSHIQSVIELIFATLFSALQLFFFFFYRLNLSINLKLLVHRLFPHSLFQLTIGSKALKDVKLPVSSIAFCLQLADPGYSFNSIGLKCLDHSVAKLPIDSK